jgi:hypothetical protein
MGHWSSPCRHMSEVTGDPGRVRKAASSVEAGKGSADGQRQTIFLIVPGRARPGRVGSDRSDPPIWPIPTLKVLRLNGCKGPIAADTNVQLDGELTVDLGHSSQV